MTVLVLLHCGKQQIKRGAVALADEDYANNTIFLSHTRSGG